MKFPRVLKIVTQVILLVVAISFLTIGLIRKEHKDVERKATTICLECIGIG